MNTISINSNNSTFLETNKSTEDNQKSSFLKLLNIDSYEDNLEKALDTLNELEKESHLKTLELLKKEGYSEEQLNIINLHLLFSKENNLEALNLSEEDTELIDKYSSVFEEVQKAIKQKREEQLGLKPLQSTIFMTDTLLKSKDIIDGINPQEHILNIEV